MPPEEELPLYPGHSKQRKTPSRDPVVLSRQQQAEANRVKIRSATRAAQEDVEPPARRLPPLAQVVRGSGSLARMVLLNQGKQCYLLDPMQLKSHITSLRTEVCTVVEPMLKMTDQIPYETITGCGYLRMRYLHKVIKLQSHFPVEDEPEEEK
ncbi:hypothetical protein PInf_015976 [Phytophthora infestans]|nr:hypothetical protein PInf_015976 [Phytophthora infestans]